MGNIVSTSSSTHAIGILNPLRYRGYVYDTDTGFYYLQSRYYDPKIGRFINADSLVSTGQGLLGFNMFAYCLNNPVCYSDPAGEKAKIWPILFEEHDPGFIHRAVQAHIVVGSILKSELVLPGIGRADIYNPETGEIWEIKHGGSSTETIAARTDTATQQIKRYVAFDELTLKPGHAYAFSGSFVINCDSISYLIEYHTPADGVILYHVQQLEKYNNSPYVVKYRKNTSLAQASNSQYAYTVVFMGFVLGCASAVVISLQPNSNPS